MESDVVMICKGHHSFHTNEGALRAYYWKNFQSDGCEDAILLKTLLIPAAQKYLSVQKVLDILQRICFSDAILDLTAGTSPTTRACYAIQTELSNMKMRYLDEDGTLVDIYPEFKKYAEGVKIV